MRSVPPYSLGGTASISDETWAIFMRWFSRVNCDRRFGARDATRPLGDTRRVDRVPQLCCVATNFFEAKKAHHRRLTDEVSGFAGFSAEARVSEAGDSPQPAFRLLCQ